MKLKDIARIAEVSPSTVSKVVNGRDAGISAETREKVLRVVREYHYAPYASATAKTKSWTIGVILSSSSTADPTLSGIIAAAQKHGYAPLVFCSNNSQSQEEKNLAAMAKHQVDGLIWEPVAESGEVARASLDQLDMPIVTVGDTGEGRDCGIPLTDIAYQLTTELIELGHTRVGCLVGQGRGREAFLRGYRRCLFDNSLTVDESAIISEANDTVIGRVNNQTLTGIVASDYSSACQLTETLSNLHYRVPDSLSVVALKYGDAASGRSDAGSISAIGVDATAFGSHLCHSLVDLIEKKKQGIADFPLELVLGDRITVGPPPDVASRHVVVAGSIHLDNYLRVPSLPTPGTTTSTLTSGTYAGGKGVNEAVGVARLGHRVTLIGNVGSDLPADQIYRAMEKEGIDTSGVERYPDEETGRSYIFVDQRGDSMVSLVPGANARLTAADIRERAALFNGADYCLVQTEIPLDAVRQVLEEGRKHGATTVLKPASCGVLPADLVSLVDLLVPNRAELDQLCPGDASMRDKAASLIDMGAGAVLVTRGGQGAYLLTPSEETVFDSDQAPQVDATGAGDAFISAVTAYSLYGYCLDDAIRIAAYAAGYCVSREGVTTALIDRHTLETHISRAEPDLLLSAAGPQ